MGCHSPLGKLDGIRKQFQIGLALLTTTCGFHDAGADPHLCDKLPFNSDTRNICFWYQNTCYFNQALLSYRGRRNSDIAVMPRSGCTGHSDGSWLRTPGLAGDVAP